MKISNSVGAFHGKTKTVAWLGAWLVILAAGTSPGRAESVCNPVVDPVASDTTLLRTLSRIAEDYEFKLSIADSLNRPANFNKSMTLERLVKHLTRDLSTVTRHKKVAGCATPVLTQLIVLPAGKETGMVDNQQLALEQPVEYIYIDDMESYVTSVLEGKQEAELGRMTPEQQEEFKMLRESLAAKPGEEPAQTEDTNNSDLMDSGTTGN